jgi:hypothetical protein
LAGEKGKKRIKTLMEDGTVLIGWCGRETTGERVNAHQLL